MTLPVADRSSNKNEQIVHAAEVLGQSAQRIAVFTEIYRGKKQVTTVSELAQATKLARQRVLDLSRGLANNELVTPTQVNGEIAYQKISGIVLAVPNPETIGHDCLGTGILKGCPAV